MDGQQAVKLIDRLLEQDQQRKLNDLESIVMLHIWEGMTYQKIADQLSYELDYIKQVACRMWKVLSKLLGESISKINIKSVLERHQESTPISEHLLSAEPLNKPNFHDKIPLPETSVKALETWVISDRCQSIAFFDAEKNNESPHTLSLNQQAQSQIESLIWQSLNQPITPDMLVNEILSALSMNNSEANPINCLIVNCYF
jgi:hypothetical protein